jgi:hypothetical protein
MPGFMFAIYGAFRKYKIDDVLSNESIKNPWVCQEKELWPWEQKTRA